MEQRKKILVAGAGASGLMAAIAAADAGAEVTVLEAMEKPGKKLLLTGNGRCNLTNLDPDLPDAYYGTGAAAASKLLRQFGAKELLAWFEDLGLLVQEKNGYVYPYSAQSGSVLDVLLIEARKLRIKLKYSERITEITHDPDAEHPWSVKTASWCYAADAVILACGSKTIPTTGSDGSGYALAASLGHRICTVAPALTPITCKGPVPQTLAGVRCRACVTLTEQTAPQTSRRVLRRETGELQWTKYGISGIVVFQLSRFVSLAPSGARQSVSIDFLPEFEQDALNRFLVKRAAMLGEEKTGMLLSGILHEKIIPVVLSLADRKLKGKKPLAKTCCQDLSAEQLQNILSALKNFQLEVTGTKSYDIAQICAGGVDCSELFPETLESRLHKGLYFAGEILDVDGPCGGYNLQWAWTSGYLAGKSAAK